MTTSPADLLPLRPVVLGILSVLRDAPLHGYGIMKRANEHVGQRALLGPGTLYRTLKELRDEGLLEHAATPAGADARRQYYRLSELGTAVLEAETTRLRELMDAAEDMSPQQAG